MCGVGGVVGVIAVDIWVVGGVVPRPGPGRHGAEVAAFALRSRRVEAGACES